jgi:menaquinone-specific isochorismate synthase
MGDERWRWLFGMAFDGECPRSMEWDAFGPWRAWLPRCSLERIGTETVLAVHTGVNATPRDLSRARDSLRSLRPIGAGPPGVVPAHETRCDSPDHQGWTQLVADATAAIDEGPLEKVVLARKSLCSMGPVDPLHAIPHPSEQPPQTTCFAFEMAPGHVFMGCSPERLFQVDGRSIRTEALAGTRPVYGQPDTDRALGQELLASDKDQREHRHVVDGIREALTELAEWIEVSPSPSVRVLHQVQHLCTIVEAHLLSGVEPTTLLRELHPTPAVCGSPRKEARNFIRNHEPFDRGWYAGPVGWLGPGRAELAVAIRSALFFEGGMHAYAGAGIVDGSDPDSEWSELEAKSRGILEGWARP